MELRKINISDIGKIITGKTPRTSIAENYGGNIPFLTPSDDLSRKHVVKTGKTLSSIGLEEVKNCLIPEKSICVSCIGSDLGKVVMTNIPTVTNQQINSIIVREGFDPDFIYYLMIIVGRELNFMSKTSTAVPIINKSTFSNTEVFVPNLENQIRIGKILSSLDDKIELNRQINDNLEQQAQTAFNNIIAQYSECETVNLSEIAILNPKRAIAKGTFARSIEMAQLPTSGSFPAGWDMKEYNGGMKFQNGDTLMARITPCLENGKVAYINFLEENEVAFGSTEYIVITSKGAIAPEVFYFLTRHNDFVDFAVKNMNGSSGRQRVSAETIGTYKLPIISPEDMFILETIAKEALNKIKYNSLENIRLSEIRDTLLPKLMSGELEINEIDC